MAYISESNDVKAENQSLAIGGNVNSPVTVVYQNGPSQAELAAALKIAITDSGLVSALPNTKKVEWHSAIERLIDEYASQREHGQVKVIQALFESLLANQATNLTAHLVYRLKANIAICLHLQGMNAKAAELMHEACSYSPEEPRAKANKVLAYLLENKSEQAYRLGLATLKDTPTNETVAAYVLQAARVNQQLPDPHSEFCEEIKREAIVQAAHIEFLQSKGDIGWRTLARLAFDRHPEERHIRGLAAQSYLDEVVQHYNARSMISTNQKSLLLINKAQEIFESEWQELKESGRAVRPSDHANLCNLLICQNILKDRIKASELCRYLLAHCADDGQSMELVVQSSLDFDLDDIFKNSLPHLKTESLRHKYKFVKNVRDADWAELAKIQDYKLNRADPDLKPSIRIACYLAQAVLRKAEGKRKLEKYLAETSLNKRARTLLFDLSIKTELPAIIQIAYEYGIAQAPKERDLDERILFCRIAKRVFDWQTIIDLLQASVLPDEDSEGARMLALAYINESPITEDAVKFFEHFAVKGTAENYHLLLSGLFLTKRQDFKNAKLTLMQYFEHGGLDASALLALSDICHSENDTAFIVELLNRHNPEELEGTPEQKMHLAKLMILYTDASKGLSYGYRIYQQNPKAVAIALAYAHLFLLAENKIDIEATDTVAASVFFILESNEGDLVERLVPDNVEDLLELSPDEVDTLIKLSLGMKVGDSFSREGMHSNTTWTIKEIQHKYLRTFQYIFRAFETEFPDVKGPWAMKMEKNDIRPILDFIKKAAEHDESRFSDLTQRRVPIEIIAAIWKKKVSHVASMIRKYRSEIFTCLGHIEERHRAYEILKHNRGRGLVLDTYTASVAGFIGLLPILQKSYGRVYISGSTITELRHLSVEIIGAFEHELSLDWYSDSFSRGATDPAQIILSPESIQACIDALNACCEVVTYAFPARIDPTISQILKLTGSTPFEPYFIAKEKDAIFVSDDGFSREYAKALHQVENSAWLQSALDVAAETLGMTLDDYSGYIISLAQHRHSHVSLNFEAFDRVFQLDSSVELYKFQAVAQYIGIKNSDFKSHFELTKRFLARHWAGNKCPDLKIMKATGIVLENFIRIPQSLHVIRQNFNIPSPALSTYIYEWMQGHFLNPPGQSRPK
jgi:hypothetical protein